MMDTIVSIRGRLDDIRDDRHFPAHMLSAHDAMVDLLDEMEAAILALQSPPAKVER